MTFHIHDYGKVYNNGVKYVMDVFNGPVAVQEKIDGSQFSFGIIEGELCFRSHKQQIMACAPNDMFAAGVQAITALKEFIVPGYIYRGEYLAKPKHNTLKYDRVPKHHVIIFDIEAADCLDWYLNPDDVKELCDLAGLEYVPTYYQGKVESIEQLLPFLKEKKPILGGDFIEGIVIKNYEIADGSGKFLKAKIVAEDFREVHKQAWGEANPNRQDIINALVESLRTEARWNKAVAHLRENGELQEAPQDIGPLLKAVNQDILDEETEYIKEVLFKHFWKDISRGTTRGLPEWYKRKLIGVEMGIDIAA